jgi:hypothetical protein
MSWSLTLGGHIDADEQRLAEIKEIIIHEFRQIQPHLVERLTPLGLSGISFSDHTGVTLLHAPEAAPVTSSDQTTTATSTSDGRESGASESRPAVGT